jgi:integrase
LEGYPVELCKALAVTWLFAGLRNNEILRLRLGCIRWQKEDASVQNSGEILSGGAVCMLDVPVNKTSAAFTKPVDPIVGEMISVWEKVRPNGVKLPDHKTGEMVDFLFLYRLTVVGQSYLNNVLIPTLCRKAGVPTADVRGNITSHRGRSTIASQLFNAKEPMTLFELQEQHSTTPRSHRLSWRNRTLTLATLGGTSERLRYSLTKRLSAADGLRASRGSSTILDTAIAHMISSNSAHTAWHVPSVTSTCRRNRAPASGWRERKT